MKPQGSGWETFWERDEVVIPNPGQIFLYPPQGLTYPLKSYLPNRKVVFQPPFFRVYVKLRGSNSWIIWIYIGHLGENSLTQSPLGKNIGGQHSCGLLGYDTPFLSTKTIGTIQLNEKKKIPLILRHENSYNMASEVSIEHGYSLDLPPTQDSTHHQDYETLLVGNPYKPSFVTGILGGRTPGGIDQRYSLTNPMLFSNSRLQCLPVPSRQRILLDKYHFTEILLYWNKCSKRCFLYKRRITNHKNNVVFIYALRKLT